MNVSGSNIPFHIARAYGIQQAQPVRPAAQPAPTEPTAPAANTGPTQAPSNIASRLVGGIVPGSIDFSGVEPTQTTGALPFYRHPADQNAAAVAIQLGRNLDISG